MHIEENIQKMIKLNFYRLPLQKKKTKHFYDPQNCPKIEDTHE